MPFRCRQKMQIFPVGKIFYSVATPNPDTGILQYEDVAQQVKLPDVEMTDLAACLKAGVSLEKTNCKLISPDFHGLVDRIESAKDPVPSSVSSSSNNSSSEE